MIPEADVEITCDLPSRTRFWVPTDEEVTEDEGIGFFRGTWLIYNCPGAYARQIIADEARLIALVDRFSSNREEFEQLACGVERPNLEVDELSEELKASLPEEILDAEFRREESLTDCLELGVAGLVHALSAAGFLTAASCRSHPSERSWSKHPVVVFVSDRRHMEKLQPLLERSNCGVYTDGQLFGLYARTIRDTARLASTVLDNCHEFGPPVFKWEHQGAENEAYYDPDQLELPGI